VSDRSLCYLASGKPAVVQDTGPSAFLPAGEGLLRFSTVEEAAEALATVDAHYEHHCRAARAIAETHFDAHTVLPDILNLVETTRGRASAAMDAPRFPGDLRAENHSPEMQRSSSGSAA
jgi:glycosyltransferase involved in cell wall biosynthesis